MPKSLENAGEFRLFIYELTESKIFSIIILFVILLNTVILVSQTDESFAVTAGKQLISVEVKVICLCFQLFR